MPAIPRPLLWLLAAFCALPSCLAPPPPILVETPFGGVRAANAEKATEIAALLEDLAPRVQEVLPGSQDRAIDVWVQEKLRVYRFNERPESVRGFTLLSDEFRAKRIHLQEDGQSPWYLSHELVHALIGTSWKTLPGIMEEGLADVVAEQLNPTYASHIRAHRLLNASAFSEGFYLRIAYNRPERDRPSSDWERRIQTFRAETTAKISAKLLPRIFSTSRNNLHEEWPEIPEAFYGMAWLITSRIAERGGLEKLHELCLRAEREGYEIVPVEWIFEAADVDWDRMDTEFLSACFGPGEMRAAAYLQPELFSQLAIDLLKPMWPAFRNRRALFWYVKPALRLSNGSEVPIRSIGPLMGSIFASWNERPLSSAN